MKQREDSRGAKLTFFGDFLFLFLLLVLLGDKKRVKKVSPSSVSLEGRKRKKGKKATAPSGVV